jgi:hypothetical protein
MIRNKFIQKSFASLTLLSLLGFTSVSAQYYTTSDVKCPEYTFSRTLVQGATGADVKLIQQILNLDYRTRVAPSGVGSKDHETYMYGVATREALKRFQALFIELIGSADGKFNSRTLTVMNAVCKGPYFTGGGGTVFSGIDGTNGTTTTTTISTTTTATTTTPTPVVQTDTTGPVVTISAPTPGFTDETFRVWIVANEPIKTFSLDNFINLGGANLSDLRKESPTTYKVLVTPGKLASHTISLQLEADAIQDLVGNKNSNASNELTLQLNPRPEGPDIIPPSVSLTSGSLGVMTINKSGAVDPANLTVSFSEPVNGSFTLADLVVRGSVTVSDLKKLDGSNYSLVVNAPATDRTTGSVQFPAGLMADVAGNKNTLSAEYQFTVVKLPDVSTTTTTATTTTTSYTPPTYDTGGQPDSGSSNSSDMLMYLLMGSQALKGLTSLFGSNPFGSTGGTIGGTTSPGSGGTQLGGATGISSPCGCMLQRRTTQFIPAGLGAPGFYFSELNPTVQAGCNVVGTATMIPAGPANICGQQIIPPTKYGCPPNSIPFNGACCWNPQFNVAGALVIGTFPPPPALRGCGI